MTATHSLVCCQKELQLIPLLLQELNLRLQLSLLLFQLISLLL